LLNKNVQASKIRHKYATGHLYLGDNLCPRAAAKVTGVFISS
jgi:hypothetical protein